MTRVGWRNSAKVRGPEGYPARRERITDSGVALPGNLDFRVRFQGSKETAKPGGDFVSNLHLQCLTA